MALSLIGVEDMTTDQDVSGLNPDDVTKSQQISMLAFFVFTTLVF